MRIALPLAPLESRLLAFAHLNRFIAMNIIAAFSKLDITSPTA